MSSLPEFQIPPGGAVIVDRLGSRAFLSLPSREFGVFLDLGGRLNKQTEDRETRYLFAPGQVSELIADLVTACAVLPQSERQTMTRELTAAFARLEST